MSRSKLYLLNIGQICRGFPLACFKYGNRLLSVCVLQIYGSAAVVLDGEIRSTHTHNIGFRHGNISVNAGVLYIELMFSAVNSIIAAGNAVCIKGNYCAVFGVIAAGFALRQRRCFAAV